MTKIKTKKPSLTARQKHLISKLQDKTCTEKEKDELITSLNGIIVKLAVKYKDSFPEETIDEMISDAFELLWPMLLRYNPERSNPSTYCYHVVNSVFLKKYTNKKNKKIAVGTKDDQVYMTPVSLDEFCEAYGELNELAYPQEEDKKISEEREEFNDKVQTLADQICHDVMTYKILISLLNTKKLASFVGQKKSDVVFLIAKECNASTNSVHKVIDKVKALFGEDNLIKLLMNYSVVKPKFNAHIDICDIVFHNDIIDVVELYHATGMFELPSIEQEQAVCVDVMDFYNSIKATNNKEVDYTHEDFDLFSVLIEG